MASYVENMSSKMGWDNVLQRGFPQPLDRSSIFSSLDDANAYASGGTDSRGLSQTSYVGQIITVYENDAVDVYKINAARKLEPVGEGKGIIIVNNENEANVVASKTKSIGNMIMRLDNQTLYIVKYDASQNKNILIEMFKIQNNEIICDSGTF